MSAPERRYYPHDYTDEVVPCDCTLEGWAEWFSKPDPEWNRPEAAKDGDTFLAQVAEITEIECRRTATGWAWSIDGRATSENRPVAGADYYLRHGSGRGWWADNSGETVSEALECALDVPVGGFAYLAAMVFAEEVELRFNLTEDGPRVFVVSQVGRA